MKFRDQRNPEQHWPVGQLRGRRLGIECKQTNAPSLIAKWAGNKQ